MGASHVKEPSQESHTQSQDSRDEILKAATHLFANRGFHETSMSEVAREARVSKALIFWHFKAKEELFLAVLNRLLEPYVIDFAEESRVLDERQQILKLVEFYLLFVRDNLSSVRFFLAQMLREQNLSETLNEQVMRLYNGYRGMLVELIARAQQRGLCGTGFAPEAAAGFIVSALNGLLIEFLFVGDSAINPESATAMVDEWLFRAGAKSVPNGNQGAA
jgi:AcrR family transcriptional regulator